MIKKLLHIL